jgi:hypothetical protein
MVTELVGHHVVNSRSAKLGPIHAHIEYAAARLSVVTGIIFAAGRVISFR